jgi:hypothetical protein
MLGGTTGKYIAGSNTMQTCFPQIHGAKNTRKVPANRLARAVINLESIAHLTNRVPWR